MKKLLSIVLILSAIFVVSGCSAKANEEKTLIGIYHCDSWQNRGQAVIMLKNDGACDGPFVYQESEWKQEGDIIKIIGGDDITETVYIVDEGLVYNSHFFKKLK